MVVASRGQIGLVASRVEGQTVDALLVADEGEVAVGLGDGPDLRGEASETIP